MPKIKTPSGVYKYKTKPLYPGVKQIDKEVSRQNLFLFQKLFNSYRIPFMLAWGTLLGAVREHDFITHDEDIDLVVKEEYRERFLANLENLRKEGFELVRYDRRDLYSLMRNGEYIDLYFYRPVGDGLWYCSGYLVADDFMREPDEIEFLGGRFLTHSNHMDAIETEYGSSWNVPIVYNNYNMPAHKKLLFCIKEHLKDWLPKPLFKILVRKAEARMRNRSYAKYLRYEELKKERRRTK